MLTASPPPTPFATGPSPAHGLSTTDAHSFLALLRERARVQTEQGGSEGSSEALALLGVFFLDVALTRR